MLCFAFKIDFILYINRLWTPKSPSREHVSNTKIFSVNPCFHPLKPQFVSSNKSSFKMSQLPPFSVHLLCTRSLDHFIHTHRGHFFQFCYWQMLFITDVAQLMSQACHGLQMGRTQATAMQFMFFCSSQAAIMMSLM